MAAELRQYATQLLAHGTVDDWRRAKYDSAELATAVFHVVDVDSSGTIDEQELFSALKHGTVSSAAYTPRRTTSCQTQRHASFVHAYEYWSYSYMICVYFVYYCFQPSHTANPSTPPFPPFLPSFLPPSLTACYVCLCVCFRL